MAPDRDMQYIKPGQPKANVSLIVYSILGCFEQASTPCHHVASPEAGLHSRAGLGILAVVNHLNTVIYRL